MEATRFERPPASLFAAVSLTAMIAAFAIGQARAQTVNPVPPPPPPVFNPSSPSTVPQAPEVPVSPTPPPAACRAPRPRRLRPPSSRRLPSRLKGSLRPRRFACHRAAACRHAPNGHCARARAGFACRRAAASRHASNGHHARSGNARSIANACRPSRRCPPPLEQASRPFPCRARAWPVLLSGFGRILSALCQSLPFQPHMARLLRGTLELLRLSLVSAKGG